MTTFDTARHPLEFAWIAARHLNFPDAQINSLRRLADRYAKSEAAEDKKKALKVLDEFRQLHQKQVNEVGNRVVPE